jgi:chromosomal replication initiation ATPase DnaA
MFAVSASRTMKNARPKHVESDVVVRDIVQIREEKRREEEQKAKEAREALAALMSKYRSHEWIGRRTAKQVIESVAARHNLSFRDLVGKCQWKEIVKARHEAVRLVADEFPHLPATEIGRIFGGRDHTTILHSLKKTKKEGSPR